MYVMCPYISCVDFDYIKTNGESVPPRSRVSAQLVSPCHRHVWPSEEGRRRHWRLQCANLLVQCVGVMQACCANVRLCTDMQTRAASRDLYHAPNDIINIPSC